MSQRVSGRSERVANHCRLDSIRMGRAWGHRSRLQGPQCRRWIRRALTLARTLTLQYTESSLDGGVALLPSPYTTPSLV